MADMRRSKQELVDLGVAAVAKLGPDFGTRQFSRFSLADIGKEIFGNKIISE